MMLRFQMVNTLTGERRDLPEGFDHVEIDCYTADQQIFQVEIHHKERRLCIYNYRPPLRIEPVASNWVEIPL